jgi:hypothetical protein
VNIIPAFFWTDYEKPRKTSAQPVSQPGFETGISLIKVRRVTA